MQKEAWLLCIFLHNHNYQGGKGKFIYKALILGNKQLLSNMIDCEATKVPYITSDCLPHRQFYIMLKLHSQSLCYSYIAIYIASKLASYIASQLSSISCQFLDIRSYNQLPNEQKWSKSEQKWSVSEQTRLLARNVP